MCCPQIGTMWNIWQWGGNASKIDVNCLKVIHTYNSNIRGVNSGNQYHKYYKLGVWRRQLVALKIPVPIEVDRCQMMNSCQEIAAMRSVYRVQCSQIIVFHIIALWNIKISLRFLDMHVLMDSLFWSWTTLMLKWELARDRDRSGGKHYKY